MSLGIGAMLHQLGGGSEHSSSEYKDKIIKAIRIDDNKLHITFEDGVSIQVFDDGQSCCESRYMVCDDDLEYLVGKKLVHIASKDATSESEEWGGEHEVVFVEVMTNDGFITIANHNEHNGYYGGFGLTIKQE
jgi:hypothetical protein